MKRLLLTALAGVLLAACGDPVAIHVDRDTGLPAPGPDAEVAAVPEDTAARCSDGQDNDGNGEADCDDAGCALFVFCQASGADASLPEPRDASLPNLPDAAVGADAAAPDASEPVDASAPDASEPADASAADASEPARDAGRPDASLPSDAGQPDASTSADASTPLACSAGSSLEFGAVATGTSFSKNFVITNPTSQPISLTLGNLSGPDAAAFSLPGIAPGLHTVPAGGTLVLPVQFAPQHLGLHSAQLSFAVPNACGLAAVALTGSGVEQILECFPKVRTVDPATGQERFSCRVDFGFVQFGTAKQASVGFRNLGSAAVTVSSFSFSATAFSFPTPPTSIQLQSGESVQLTIAFQPAQLGVHVGSLSFKSTDLKLPSGAFQLAGTGGGPLLDIVPSFDFGLVPVGGSATRPISFANAGTDVPAMTLDNLRLIAVDAASSCAAPTDCASGLCIASQCWNEQAPALSGASAAEFGLVLPPSGYSAAGLAAGQSAQLQVKLTPTSAGAKAAKLRLFTNDSEQPITEVDLTGQAAVLPPCDLEITPAALSFGTLEPGQALELSVFVRNLSSNPANQCVVSVPGFTAPTAAFALANGPVTGAAIKGGQTLEVPVRFAPTANGAAAAQLEILSSSTTAPRTLIAVSGAGAPECLLISPRELDFGVVQASCSSGERTLTLYNVCSAGITLQSIDVRPGLSTEFRVTSKPAGNFVLAASASTIVKAKYSPTDVGEDRGSIGVATSQGLRVIALAGQGAITPLQVDSFLVDPQAKSDVLFVVDDSGSMTAHQTNLASSFDAFMAFAETQQVDYRIAVTTTSIDAAHGNTVTGDHDENGCFVAAGANPKVITPATPNRKAVFQQNVQVGTDGSYEEMLMRPSYLALRQPNLGTCNQGFLRPEAKLAVVVVSDAYETDDVPPSFYASALLNLKGAGRANDVTFLGVVPVGPSTSACTYDGTTVSTAVPDLAAMLGGFVEPICSTNWAMKMEKIGEAAFGFRRRFFLSGTPNLAPPYAVTVDVDGLPYAATGPNGELRWTYDAATNSILFEPLAVPEPGSLMEISYHVACLN